MRILIALLTGLVLTTFHDLPQADACGVKLTVKAPRVKKRVQRSDNPSRILLLGEPPRTLAVSLSRAGHTVDVAEEPEDAKSKNYDMVVADPDKVPRARQNFPKSRVVTRTGSSEANVREVERVLARNQPQRDRDVVVARRSTPTQPTRKAEEPTGTRRIAQTPTERRTEEPTRTPTPTPTPTEVEPEPTREPTRVATLPRAEREDEVERTTPRRTEKPRQRNAKVPSFTKELYFGSNSVRLSARNRRLLMRNVRWLEANPEASLTIEGHTDASGPAEYNLILGERRAESVQSFLIEQGVDSGRIDVVSRGEDDLKYKSGSAKNRRVMLITN